MRAAVATATRPVAALSGGVLAIPRRVAAAWALLASAMAALLFPARAFAVDLTPWEGLSPFDDILNGIEGAAGDVISKGFQFIVNALFGGPPAELTIAILEWLIEIPNYGRGDSIAAMESTTTAIAFSMLACVMTYTILRFWIAGMATGSFDAVSAVGRVVAAAAAIAVWPHLFALISRLSGGLSAAILRQDGTEDNVGDLLANSMSLGTIAVEGAGIPLFLGIVVAVVGMVLLFVLAIAKVLIAAITVLLFVGMPLALVLWPLPETSWISGQAMRSFAMVCAIPVVWAIVFGSFAALWADTIFLNGESGEEVGLGGSLADAALIQPLVGLSLLYIAVTIPKKMLAMASMGGGGGGGVMRSFAYQYAFSSGYSALGSRGGRMAANAPMAAAGRVGGGSGGMGAAAAGASAASGAAPAAAGVAAAAGGAAVGAAAGAALPVAAAANATPSAAVGGAAASSAPVGGAARTSSGVSGVQDEYGGPKVAMDAKRFEQANASAQAMAETSPRPSVRAVQEAHAALPPSLTEPVRAMTLDHAASDAPDASQAARGHLARYQQSAEGQNHKAELATIGAADPRTWQQAFTPASTIGDGGSIQPAGLGPAESQARALMTTQAAPVTNGNGNGASPPPAPTPPAPVDRSAPVPVDAAPPQVPQPAARSGGQGAARGSVKPSTTQPKVPTPEPDPPAAPRRGEL